jgi:hypothetical protein
MGLQQTPRRRKTPWTRYAPFIAIVVVIAIVAVVLATRGGDNKKPSAVNVGAGATPAPAASVSGKNGVPLFYADAKAQGTADSKKWHNCDTATGRVAIPINSPPPCVEEFTGNNGGATSAGVTASTIKIGYYIAKPDPTLDGVLAQAGAYDPPAQVAQTIKDYAAIYGGTYQLYGRKIQLVRIDGSGSSTDSVQARADADRAAAAGVFAVVGGPSQTKAFSDELSQKKILCVGSCIISQPQKYYEQNEPYIWPTGPSPDETSTMITSFIKNQLAGKPAKWAGPALAGKPRTFTMLTYDTPDNQYRSAWDDLETKLKATGVDVVDHVDYFLNVPTLQADARTIATRLKQKNATSILFTGDPIFPIFLTKEMTKEKYFPEWVMSGTVLADTNVFARQFDQQQWAHAFGLQLIPARMAKDKQDSYTLHQWWFKNAAPPADNSYGIIKGDVELLFDGLQLAGPNLTPTAFKNGLDASTPVAPTNAPTIQTISTYGNHGFWTGDDPAGLDNAGIEWWDPTAVGPDETGNVGTGMYRLMNGGVRYLPNQWPTTPMPLFEKADTVTFYNDSDVPALLQPKTQPLPAGAPNATG